jgi:alkylation response protein AidB-like acyl-CoA dehydrogenase
MVVTVAALAAQMRSRAKAIAEDVLFPAAEAVDRADRVPGAHLDLLMREGFYGVAAPPDEGGLGVEEMATAGHILEILASGCLATTFVWMQHHGAVLAAAFSDRPGVRPRWLGPLARGERRAGIALAGLRPKAARLGVRTIAGGFLLDGEVPWVTGWDMIDTIHLAALDADDTIHYFLVDAVAGETVEVTPLPLVAAQASRTVNLRFTGHVVPADRLVGTQPYGEWARSDAAGSALNGFLALGVARRCCRLIGPSPLDAELDACRDALLAADSGTTPAARAAASDLALRVAARLAVHTGSRAVLRGDPAERLLREASFLLVFGSRPAIRDALAARLAPPAPTPRSRE